MSITPKEFISNWLQGSSCKTKGKPKLLASSADNRFVLVRHVRHKEPANSWSENGVCETYHAVFDLHQNADKPLLRYPGRLTNEVLREMQAVAGCKLVVRVDASKRLKSTIRKKPEQPLSPDLKMYVYTADGLALNSAIVVAATREDTAAKLAAKWLKTNGLPSAVSSLELKSVRKAKNKMVVYAWDGDY